MPAAAGENGISSASVIVKPTPAGHPTAARTFYLPQLDALRLLAFLLVFLHHNLLLNQEIAHRIGPELSFLASLLQTTGAFGLSLFFFLSAYLITALMVKERSRTGSVDLQKFYIRRALRIWPLYFGFISLIALAGLWKPVAHVPSGWLLALVFLSANWYGIKHGLAPILLFQMWSISIEEQFYLVWPTVFRKLTQKTLVKASILTGFASLLATCYLAKTGSNPLGLWFNTAVEALFFAAGSLVAALEVRRDTNAYRAWLAVGMGMALWLTAELFGQIKNDAAAPVPWKITLSYGLVALGCYLLLTGFLQFPAKGIPGWVAYLGKISYGLYVFHALAMHILAVLFVGVPRVTTALPTLLVTIILATLSYRYFESPFLELKARFETVKTRAV